MEAKEWVALLRRDKAEYKRTRDQDPRAPLDLSGADLSRCDLSGVDLAGAKLRKANLRGADCTAASLRFADLSDADLRDVKLEGANLHQTNLEGANLEGATLGEANRETRVCLHWSSFRGTRWSQAELETVLAILNQNASWRIDYRLVPKTPVRA